MPKKVEIEVEEETGVCVVIVCEWGEVFKLLCRFWGILWLWKMMRVLCEGIIGPE